MELPWTEVLIGLAIFVVSSGVGAVGAVAAGAILIRLPADYFSPRRPPKLRSPAHPVQLALSRIVKNVGGAILVLLGIALAMPGVPGPGILVILLGISLADVPGKRRLERWIISRRRVLDAVNRLRRRFGRPPLVL